MFAEIKRHWLIVIMNSAVLVIGILFSCLIWILGGGRVTFGPLNSYFFVCFSIVIATMAALNAGISSIVASKSLELTRATARPFLTITSIVYQPPNIVILTICNTGAFPPDSNTFQTIFSLTKDFSELNDFNKLSVPTIQESPPIFPGEKLQLDLYLGQNSTEYVNGGKEIYVKTDIKYIYNGGKRDFTSRISHLPKSDKKRVRLPFSILSEGSSWE